MLVIIMHLQRRLQTTRHAFDTAHRRRHHNRFLQLIACGAGFLRHRQVGEVTAVVSPCDALIAMYINCFVFGSSAFMLLTAYIKPPKACATSGASDWKSSIKLRLVDISI